MKGVGDGRHGRASASTCWEEEMDTDKKEPKIDRAEYDRLDGAILETFILEFLYRNETFMRDYNELAEAQWWGPQEFYEKYGVYPGMPHTGSRLRLPQKADKPEMLKLYIPKAVAVHVYHRGQEREGGASKQGAKRDEADPGYVVYREIEGMSKKKSRTSGGFASDVEWLLHKFWGHPDPAGEYPCGDSLLIKLNAKYTAKENKKLVEAILKYYGGKKRPKTRMEEWKYYLIVFDLRKARQGLSYEKIATMLSEAYPEVAKKKSFDAKNCLNYDKQARLLIDRDYRKYI